MNKTRKSFITNILLVFVLLLNIQITYSQKVEVQGELKVTQMNINDSEDNLVVRNSDGTLGTRSVASLPPPPPPIDTTRNFASDFELAKLLCDCQNLPPLMIKKLLESGYTQEDLVWSGVPILDVINAQRTGVMIDPRDNKSYKTVTIGTQTWMAENLNYGTQIDGAINQTDNSIIEKYCNEDDANNCAIYGGLYQWDEMMQYVTTEGVQGLCPTGWHLPTDDELKTLEIELGMTQGQADLTGFRGTNQGSQLSGDSVLWTDNVLELNDAFGNSGFAAIPAGSIEGGAFWDIGWASFLWSSTESTGTGSYRRYIRTSSLQVARSTSSKVYAHGARCLKN